MLDDTDVHTANSSFKRPRLTGAKPPLKPKQVWGIRDRLQTLKRTRDLALFDLGIDSKLRGCDLVALRIADIALNRAVHSRATIIQRKTRRAVQFELTEQTRISVHSWLQEMGRTS